MSVYIYIWSSFLRAYSWYSVLSLLYQLPNFYPLNLNLFFFFSFILLIENIDIVPKKLFAKESELAVLMYPELQISSGKSWIILNFSNRGWLLIILSLLWVLMVWSTCLTYLHQLHPNNSNKSKNQKINRKKQLL